MLAKGKYLKQALIIFDCSLAPEILFEEINGQTKVTEHFDAEAENSEDMQRTGWQAILDNFKKYVEAN